MAPLTVHEHAAGRTAAMVRLGKSARWQGDGSPIDPTVRRDTASDYTVRVRQSAEAQYFRSVAGRTAVLNQDGHGLTRAEVARYRLV